MPEILLLNVHSPYQLLSITYREHTVVHRYDYMTDHHRNGHIDCQQSKHKKVTSRPVGGCGRESRLSKSMDRLTWSLIVKVPSSEFLIGHPEDPNFMNIVISERGFQQKATELFRCARPM